ncbi:DNA-directed DNA polymerase [Trapelia coarctata]|nr:DNA-directed DNA polymerase [Trapelia coarctata]
MSRKRRREPVNVTTERVAIYEDLAHENEEIRLKAAQDLLSSITPEKNTSKEELEKVFNRLFRGLCSGRKAARLGFSVVLTELIIQYVGSDSVSTSIMSITIVLKTLEDQTRISGHVSGQEERDYYLGRLFGAEAIVKSGVLFSLKSPGSHWDQLLDLIFDLAKKKSWLRKECGWVLYTALKSQSTMTAEYAQVAIDKLHSSTLARTPEGVALWVLIQSAYPDVQLPKHVWHHGNPLHRKEKAPLAKILKETSSKDDPKEPTQKDAERGTWFHKLHFAWEVVFGALLKARSKQLTFAELWTEAIDNGLFSSTASEEKKYWGFLLFQKYVYELPTTKLSTIFGSNTIRCLANQLASSERYLHRVAKKSLKVLNTQAEEDPQVASIFISALFNHGYINFDSLTKTKTIENVFGQASQSDGMAYRQILHKFEDAILAPGGEDEKSAAMYRQLVADYLVSAVKSETAPSDGGPDYSEQRDQMYLITEVLLRYAYFRIKPGPDDPNRRLPDPQISSATHEMFKTRLMSSLSRLMLNSTDPTWHPYQVVMYLGGHESGQNGLVPLMILEPGRGVGKILRKAQKTLVKIDDEVRKVDEARKGQLRAFKLLYTMSILQVYNGDADAVSMLEELQTCYTDLVKYKSEESKAEGSEILFEIILSFVSKPSLLFKRLAHQVFSAYTSLLNTAGLQSMIMVLEAKETISGQQDVFERADDQAMDSEQSDEDMSDVEVVEAVNGDAGSDDDAASSGSRSNQSEDGDGKDAELAEFNAKLAQALGTRRLDQDLAIEEESSDEDMDDDQMAALDAQLETVFKERKKATTNKNERKDAKETVVIFKSRVLELLEIYVKQQFLNPLALELILPLLTLVRTTTSKPVSEKACNLIREYSKLYKLKDQIPGEPAILERASSVMDDIHLAVLLEGSNAYGNACSQASLLAAKIIIANGGKPAVVVQRYAATQERFLTDPTCHVRTSFFSEWLNWCASARKNLGS